MDKKADKCMTGISTSVDLRVGLWQKVGMSVVDEGRLRVGRCSLQDDRHCSRNGLAGWHGKREGGRKGRGRGREGKGRGSTRGGG